MCLEPQIAICRGHGWWKWSQSHVDMDMSIWWWTGRLEGGGGGETIRLKDMNEAWGADAPQASFIVCCC